MNLLEYQAKALLSAHGVPIPRGEVLGDIAKLTFPLVVKSQVPVGGRGKLGGIKIANNKTELQNLRTELFDREIKGFRPEVLYAEEFIDIHRELYLELGINRADKTIELVAHPRGGMEVEDNNFAEFYHVAIRQSSDVRQHITSLSEALGLEAQCNVLEAFVQKTFDCFVTNDATLIEINPLILTKNSQLVAGDCKMTLDDAAAFRHPEWASYAQPTDHTFITLNPHGTVATIANGAGLAMATVDAVYARGLVPANFLDIGGGASVETILAAFHDIMQFTNVSTVVINIFGGIVRCDDVARAIIAAREQIPDLPALAIRLSGTNSREAAELLAAHHLPLHANLSELLEALA